MIRGGGGGGGVSLRSTDNEPILSSMLAAGVQDTYAGEAGEGERGKRSGDDWRLLFYQAGNSTCFVAIEFLSQITNMRTRFRNVRTYIHY